MHRLNSLRWAALPVGLLATLSITRCVDSLSDDCTKTLTCGDQAQVTLDDECRWRYPDGGLWTEGPQQEIQSPCAGNGPTAPKRRPKISGARRTEPAAPTLARASRIARCSVVIYRDSAMSPRSAASSASTTPRARRTRPWAMPAPPASATRSARSACAVSTTLIARPPPPFARRTGGETDRNECVECTIDTQCTDSEPVCDTSSNECTLRCTGNDPAECSGSPDKSVCNATRGLCVECVDDAGCTEATASQCNTTSNECVQCVDNAPCTPLGQVCDVTSSRCVQCTASAQCERRRQTGLQHRNEAVRRVPGPHRVHQPHRVAL